MSKFERRERRREKQEVKLIQAPVPVVDEPHPPLDEVGRLSNRVIFDYSHRQIDLHKERKEYDRAIDVYRWLRT